MTYKNTKNSEIDEIHSTKSHGGGANFRGSDTNLIEDKQSDVLNASPESFGDNHSSSIM